MGTGLQETNSYFEVDLEAPQDSLHHKCESYQAGDWIIFHCSLCKGYERLLNWRTGKMKVKNDRVEIYHHGHNVPLESKQVTEVFS